MKDYELTLVLPGDASSAKKKSAIEKIEKLVKTLKGKVKKMNDWGKIDLVYPIKKKSVGNFLYFEVELGSPEAKSIPGKLKLEGDIIRYLLVRRE